MLHRARYNSVLMCGAAALAISATASRAHADDRREFNIAPQPLATALMEFGAQSGVAVVAPGSLTAAKTTRGVSAQVEPEAALQAMLAGTGLTYRREGELFAIVRAGEGGSDPQSSSAAGDGAEGTVEALIVTAQKREEDIQDVPIAMSAFTQEQLERSQVAGGPDLMTQVPNMTFTKTNFSSYSIQIRGIGTQAISATVDPAVAVAFNNTPFIRNRFFEQEFYDLQRVEVLRGPQGTLYGRNATAGVVNLISQKPSFGYEAKLSADISNYNSTRLEGMLNVPLAEDMVALRVAGAWTKREGYVTNEITGNPIDGRDLWSTRVSLRFAPTDRFDANLIWEHFQEDDDRLRSGKQLCHTDDRETLGGYIVPLADGVGMTSQLYSQGCLPASLYSPDSFEVPNGRSLPYYLPLKAIFVPVVAMDPYVSTTQSRDLRVIESSFDPTYRAKSDAVELQFNFDLTDDLTLSSETSYNSDFIYSTQDFNRFNTKSGIWDQQFWDFLGESIQDFIARPGVLEDGVFCDPQVGCSDRLVAFDLSTAKSRQFSQELRLASNYDGSFNFSLGANYLRYDTMDKYYVFINTMSAYAAISPYAVSPSARLGPYGPGVDNSECMVNGLIEADIRDLQTITGCVYIDPNPIESLNDLGHNYFLSKNPYKLISYAVFGEAYYNITDNLKVTAGLRWTVDKKEAPRVPSWVLAANSVGYPVLEVVNQEWRKPTGRLAIDWKPDLSFTDETLLYVSYAHGYKAGGSNPPPTGTIVFGTENTVENVAQQLATKPRTFDPEYVDAYEIGAKNTLLDGRMTLNVNAFYYDYQAYQISQIIDRSAVNYNFDAKVWGLELESDWRPLENLRVGLKLGYENTRVADGSQAIDIMERNYGHGPDSDDPWLVIRPFPTQTSNCVVPLYTQINPANGVLYPGEQNFSNGQPGPCEWIYMMHLDPRTGLDYVPDPTVTAPNRDPGTSLYPGYPGFDYRTAPNNGEGFMKPLGGNELPNAPHYTATLTADYTIPLPNDWLATLHTDLYYQSEAWTRIFNMEGFDKLKAYTNVNLAAIFTNEDAGWKVMAYVKNVFDRDSITGAFLNSDDTGLTSNVFLTEPRLYGLRVTKDFSGGPWWTGADPDHAGPYPLTIEVGGQVQRHDGDFQPIKPDFGDALSDQLNSIGNVQDRDWDTGDGRSLKISWRPWPSPWLVSSSVRYGRVNNDTAREHREEAGDRGCSAAGKYAVLCDPEFPFYQPGIWFETTNWSDTAARSQEDHLLVDFMVGRDMGLGAASGFASRLSAGVRYAQFDSKTRLEAHSVPDWYLPDYGVFKYGGSLHDYEADLTQKRSFEGAGPVLSWEASQRLWESGGGHVDVEWSLAGGALFGKQEVSQTGAQIATSRSGYIDGGIGRPDIVGDPVVTAPPPPRSTDVSVPLLDLSLGLSYEVQRFKIGAGYRWERYFDVLDAGWAAHQDYDRTLDGPYLKLSVGFGG